MNDVPTPRPAAPRSHKRSRKNSVHHWARWLHVYTSMLALIVVLFFAVTGVTVNHPEWTLGFPARQSSAEGTLPARAVNGASVDWLMVSEYLRDTHGIRGHVSDRRSDETQGSIRYNGPGFEASATFDLATRAYRVAMNKQGLIGVMNDLHKGRDSRRSWNWGIDVAAGFLIVVSLTGLLMQFFLRKRRRSGLTTAGVGLVVVVVMLYVATR